MDFIPVEVSFDLVPWIYLWIFDFKLWVSDHAWIHGVPSLSFLLSELWRNMFLDASRFVLFFNWCSQIQKRQRVYLTLNLTHSRIGSLRSTGNAMPVVEILIYFISGWHHNSGNMLTSSDILSRVDDILKLGLKYSKTLSQYYCILKAGWQHTEIIYYGTITSFLEYFRMVGWWLPEVMTALPKL